MDIKKVMIGKGQMPNGCGECEVTWISSAENWDHCMFYGMDVSEFYDIRHPDCPLVENEVE